MINRLSYLPINRLNPIDDQSIIRISKKAHLHINYQKQSISNPSIGHWLEKPIDWIKWKSLVYFLLFHTVNFYQNIGLKRSLSSKLIGILTTVNLAGWKTFNNTQKNLKIWSWTLNFTFITLSQTSSFHPFS